MSESESETRYKEIGEVATRLAELTNSLVVWRDMESSELVVNNAGRDFTTETVRQMGVGMISAAAVAESQMAQQRVEQQSS